MMKQLRSLAIPPHPLTKLPTYNADFPAWIQYGNNVSYDKDGFCLKFKIKNIPSLVYNLSSFMHHSNTHEIWW